MSFLLQIGAVGSLNCSLEDKRQNVASHNQSSNKLIIKKPFGDDQTPGGHD